MTIDPEDYGQVNRLAALIRLHGGIDYRQMSATAAKVHAGAVQGALRGMASAARTSTPPPVARPLAAPDPWMVWRHLTHGIAACGILGVANLLAVVILICVAS